MYIRQYTPLSKRVKKSISRGGLSSHLAGRLADGIEDGVGDTLFSEEIGVPVSNQLTVS